MTSIAQRKILQSISDISQDVADLERVLIEIAKGGTASASLSSGGGSKSYTRLDIRAVEELIRSKKAELAAYRARLNGGAGIRRIMCLRGGW